MEYVAGGTLQSRLAAGPLPVDDVLRLGTAIADALDNAHRHGFLHRDLKPGNIALTVDGHPKILDFGIAMLLADDNVAGRITQAGMVLGSLPYMSPEQLTGEECDARTDIYALGVMLFEMLTGQRPFVKERSEALMFAIISNAAQSVRTLRPDVPEAVDRLIAECLRKDPSQRPLSAARVSQVLRGIREGVPTAALPLPRRDVVRAIAVLPLRNVSRDPAQEYFADGMTESIISDLARVKARWTAVHRRRSTPGGAHRPRLRAWRTRARSAGRHGAEWAGARCGLRESSCAYPWVARQRCRVAAGRGRGEVLPGRLQRAGRTALHTRVRRAVRRRGARLAGGVARGRRGARSRLRSRAR